jgi:hypothetical protein
MQTVGSHLFLEQHTLEVEEEGEKDLEYLFIL